MPRQHYTPPRAEREQAPVAYGYIRVEVPDEDTVSRLRQEIGAFCETESVHLVNVFCDRGIDGSTLARTGLTDLLDTLKQVPQAALVVPDLGHLSPYDSIRSVLVRRLHRSQHRLLVVSDTDGAIDFGGSDLAAGPDIDGGVS